MYGKNRLYALEHHNNQYIKAHNCPNNHQNTLFQRWKDISEIFWWIRVSLEGVASDQQPLCCCRNRPTATSPRGIPLALWFRHTPHLLEFSFSSFSVFKSPHDVSLLPFTVASLGSGYMFQILWTSTRKAFCLWCHRVLVPSDNPKGDYQPGFMYPMGSTSTKMVLRGETLELECIAEGL